MIIEPDAEIITVMLNEAKTSRPRPELRAEAKNNYEKVPNND